MAEPTLLPGTPSDAPEVLVLQRCCWVVEAIAHDTLDGGIWRIGRLMVAPDRQGGGPARVCSLMPRTPLRRGSGGSRSSPADAARGTSRCTSEPATARMSEDEAVVHLEKPARGVREHARRLTRR